VGDEDEGSMAESQSQEVTAAEGSWLGDCQNVGVGESDSVDPVPCAANASDADIADVDTTNPSALSASPTTSDAATANAERDASERQVEDSAGGATLEAEASDLGTTVPAAVEEVTGEMNFEESVPSDHNFLNCTHPSGPGSRQFLRRVQKEWSILQRGLPRGVWVHVYPDRMELLRACLEGPQGTPYSDALFFFDVYLPPTYPQSPPQVKFWSYGENLNPNLYENGKVCLSLLGTWSGKDSETWCPERSNLLQVLVSILGLVLNTEPYYNEPGFEREKDTLQGGVRAQRYNESVALSSYHLMLRVLRSQPLDFNNVVKRHFAERRAVILERARELRSEGSSSSEGFLKSLAALLPRLEDALPDEVPPT
jgi:ubiquitin-protein ligase